MKIRDLSVPINDETSMPPRLPTFEMGRCFKHEDGDIDYESDYMVTTTHIGTHVDAPYHFIPDGGTVGDISLDSLIRPTKRADVRDLVGPKTRVTLDMVKDRLSAPLEEGEYLLVHTGWSDKHMNTPEYFSHNHPYYDPEISEYIVKQDGRGILADTTIEPVHDVSEEGFANHYTLLGNDKLIVENIVNVDSLPNEFTTYVIPMYIDEGDGAPARVFVIEDNDEDINLC